MSVKPIVEIPVEPEMMEAIEMFCTQTGIDRTELLVWALSRSFEFFTKEFERRKEKEQADGN